MSYFPKLGIANGRRRSADNVRRVGRALKASLPTTTRAFTWIMTGSERFVCEGTSYEGRATTRAVGAPGVTPLGALVLSPSRFRLPHPALLSSTSIPTPRDSTPTSYPWLSRTAADAVLPVGLRPGAPPGAPAPSAGATAAA